MTRTAKPTTFGERLRLARERAGFSQGDLAGSVGLASGRAAIHAYESGRVDPKRGTIERLAKVLNVSACWLAFGDER